MISLLLRCLLVAVLGGLAALPLCAQKMKIKKGDVFVDKELQYRFTASEQRSLLNIERPDYELTGLDGTVHLAYRDTAFYMGPLPHEINPRLVYRATQIAFPQAGLDTIVTRPGGMGLTKKMLRPLDDLGFFREGPSYLDAGFLDRLAQKFGAQYVQAENAFIDTTRQDRITNYEATVAKFGPIPRRENGAVTLLAGKVMDGDKVVGKLVPPTDPGSYALIYKVINADNELIGTLALMTAGNEGNFRSLANNNRYWLTFKLSESGTPRPLDDRLAAFARLIVLKGYL